MFGLDFVCFKLKIYLLRMYQFVFLLLFVVVDIRFA